MPTGRFTRYLATASCERELETWLTAVDREALAHAGENGLRNVPTLGKGAHSSGMCGCRKPLTPLAR